MSADEQGRPKGGLFYGWYIVATVFVSQTVSCGLIFYNLSILLKVFVAQSGFSVSATSTATASFFIAGGVAGLGVGWLIDRYDPRIIITFGAICAACALAFAGHVHALWQLYLFYILFGIGNAAVAVIPGITIVARWFSRQRSRAIAYASTGLSLGGIIFTPISVTLIQNLGLEHAAYWFALILILGTVPISWIFLRPDPASMGLAPDGDAPKLDSDGRMLAPDGVSFEEAIRSRFFILFTTAYVFSMMAQVGSLAHQVRLVATRTGDDHIAALAVSVMAAASVTGRLVGGSVLHRISSKRYLQGVFILQAAAFTLFAFAEGATALLIVSAMFGATVGNMQMMQPLIVAEAFGLKAYARILSLAQMITTCANAIGPALMGFLYERAGGYEVPYLAIAASSLIGITALTAAGPVRAMIDKR
ncbi:MAG: MFS transporter [Parvibaculum sp.]|jgi:MFS family permease|uniref:MFS transporter n=1 Tax=Parvibaculum sp. TaxID=2024848 RepID=UPI0028490D33|nr:MFS transporter [Parvibaculum sp.]MDR3498638.1 MFS transporter [Parvibaculum sp.]